MPGGEELYDDEETSEGEGDEAVDKRATEADTADGRRTHSAEEDELPFVVQWRLDHQVI